MTYPLIIENHNEDILSIETRFQQFQNNLINLIYPIGSIYMSVNNVSPSTFLGGTWEQVKDTFLLCSGDTYSAGSTGGEASHTLSVAETPAHTHTRGTMEITGYIQDRRPGTSASPDTVCGGALSAYGSTNWPCSVQQVSATYPNGIKLTASKSWTGATSSVGSGQAHNNMPPYLAVYVWKRTA